MKRSALVTMVCMAVLLIVSLMLYSCGHHGSRRSGTSGIYVTDDPSDGGSSGIEQSLLISGTEYSQVTTTINTVQLINSETGEACNLLNIPLAVDLANLANTMELESVTDCPTGSYDRIQVQFADSFELVMGTTGTASSCQLIDYKETGSEDQPNIPFCENGICTMNINGAIDVLADEGSKTGLHFYYKEFIVEQFGTPDCTVTLKVSPLNNSKIKQIKEQFGRLESVKGLISNVTTTSFDVSRGNKTFNVLYSGLSGSNPGLEAMLQSAENDGLRVRVMAPDIDLKSGSITATKISSKVEGTVSIFE